VTLIFWMYVVSGVLFIALGLPMAARRVPPNGWYGFRTPKTLKPGNERIWYDANAYCGRLLQWVGLLTAAGTVGFWYVPGLTVDTYSLACLVVMMTGIVWMCVASFRYLATLK
jgi:hypothetical protein